MFLIIYFLWLHYLHIGSAGGFFNWLITNSRPCPNQCGQSINKLDGCNRVKCSKCAFECCWVCLESWRKHPMCNRFLDVGNNIELRFIHFYIRYKNHHNSYNIEKGIDFITDRSRYKPCHSFDNWPFKALSYLWGSSSF